jgi:hypothetical protein
MNMPLVPQYVVTVVNCLWASMLCSSCRDMEATETLEQLSLECEGLCQGREYASLEHVPCKDGP